MRRLLERMLAERAAVMSSVAGSPVLSERKLYPLWTNMAWRVYCLAHLVSQVLLKIQDGRLGGGVLDRAPHVFIAGIWKLCTGVANPWGAALSEILVKAVCMVDLIC